MSQCEAAKRSRQVGPQAIDKEDCSPLGEVLCKGARGVLVKAVEAEVPAYLETHHDEVDEHGRWSVVRNGHDPQRTIVSAVEQPENPGATRRRPRRLQARALVP